MSAGVTIAGRVSQEISEQVDRLAAATQRSRSWIVEEAIRHYLEEHAWQVQAIQEALDDYRAGNAKLVPHEAIEAGMQRLEAEIEAGLGP